MWFYIGILTILATAYYKSPTGLASATRGVYSIIRRNGLGICLMWTQQVIANQIGRHLVEMHHTHYIIHYPYGVSWYKIVVPRRRRPCLIDTITSGDRDVKRDVLAFMGPSHNFHGTQITPKMLGYGSLTFSYLNGNTQTFTENEIITF